MKRLLALSLVVLGGCTVGPDYVAPETAMPEAYRANLPDADVAPEQLSNWWTQLDDPMLDELLARATTANLDLRRAESQLRQARAQRRITGSTLLPTVGASGGAQRTESSSEAGTGARTDLYSSGFDASWEVDLFGGRRRTQEAADADLEAQIEDQRTTLVSVLAEVALNYVDLRLAQRRRAVARENVALQEQTLEIVEAQYTSGVVNRIDYDRALANLQTTRAELPRIEQAVAQATNRLNVLVGEMPGSVTALDAERPIPQPSIDVAVGIPADLLRRRPDVRGAERRLAAETARVGVAMAEFYPKLSLSGSVGLDALDLDSLLGADAARFGLGLAGTVPVFTGGRLRAQLEVQNAVQEQALIAYEASVLGAVEEVENAVVALAQEQVRRARLAEAFAAAERAESVASMRYEAGAEAFLTVLDAQRSRLSAQDGLTASEATVTGNLIRLYKALGGGWTPAD